MDKNTRTFLIIYILMIISVLFLHGCSKLGLRDSEAKGWDVHVVTTSDTCEVRIQVQQEAVQTDDTVTLNPEGRAL